MATSPAAQAKTATFRRGVIEGFFGRSWPWEARYTYAGFLKEQGFGSYIYAPKADRSLRQSWSQPFDASHQEALSGLCAHYRDLDLDFGIGLSPFELYLNFDNNSKQLLKQKIEAINDIGPSTLCIQFDDMVGSVADLAQIQTDIMHFAMEHSSADHFIFCPTYYSEDPILVRHFGEKPDNYLQALGQHMAPEVDIFWTGPKVFSPDYPAEHLMRIGELLQRPPMIWDNYPVNDSARLCKHLLLAPAIRDISALQQYSSGHMVNPMNQPRLSQIPLVALNAQYAGETDAVLLLEKAIKETAPGLPGELLVQDQPVFQQQGLAAMTPDEQQTLLRRYKPFAGNALVDEVIDWLEGGYTFDPACLT